MLKILIAVVCSIFLLTACNNEQAPQQRLEAADVVLPETFDAERAQAAYKKYCSSCHGGNLQGAPAYPLPITGIAGEEVYIAIVQGVGKMPGGLVKGEEAENLAAWIAVQQ